jgi:hypothetical protein
MVLVRIERNTPPERPRRRWKCNIKMDLKETGLEGLDCVNFRLGLNFNIEFWGYTLDREDKVSGEISVTILHSS